jgi:hypothetical protein
VQPPGLFLALQKTTGNNSGCKRNQYRYFVKVAKNNVPKWNAQALASSRSGVIPSLCAHWSAAIRASN